MYHECYIYKLSDNIIDSIRPYIKNKSDDDLEIAKYGLNLFFMELYKFPILFGIAYYLGILKLFISLMTIYLLYNYAPADTEARPLLNENTRKKKKKSFNFYWYYIFVFKLYLIK